MALADNTSTPERVSYYALWVVCWAIFFFLLAPILVVLPLSFSSETLFTYPIPGWSFRWYEDYLTNPAWQRATKNTFIIATATMVLATPLGTLAALGLHRATFRYKGALLGVMIAPLIVPIIITATGLFFFFSRLGLTSSLDRPHPRPHRARRAVRCHHRFGDVERFRHQPRACRPRAWARRRPTSSFR